MKIILAHNSMRVGGGAEHFFLETGRVLEANGHEVAYFSTLEEGSPSSPWQEYFVKPVDYASGTIAEKVFGVPATIYSHTAKKKMKSLIRAFKPDLVHVFAVYIKLTPSILDACREEGVPVLMSCNDYKHVCANYKMYHHGQICDDCIGAKYYKPIVNRCAKDSIAISVASSLEAYTHGLLNIYRKNVRTFLFASSFMAKKTEEFWGAESFRWKLLRNPFDPLQYKARTDPGAYVLYFGRLVEEKGIDVLIEAASNIGGARVIIVGDGPDRLPLQAQATQKGLNNVEFLGAKWGIELNAIIEKCRFVVVPSLWHENFPYVILQAFAHGKPVIGARRGGIPEMVSEQINGVLYEATNSRELAVAMNVLLEDGGMVERMGAAGRAYVDAEFGDERFLQSLMRVYEEALV